MKNHQIINRLIQEQLELLPEKLETAFGDFETQVETVYAKAIKDLMMKLEGIKIKKPYQRAVKRQLNYIVYGELIPKIMEIKEIFLDNTKKK